VAAVHRGLQPPIPERQCVKKWATRNGNNDLYCYIDATADIGDFVREFSNSRQVRDDSGGWIFFPVLGFFGIFFRQFVFLKS
jgi:hypothetical protein